MVCTPNNLLRIISRALLSFFFGQIIIRPRVIGFHLCLGFVKVNTNILSKS